MTKFELVIPADMKESVFVPCLDIVKNLACKWAYALHPVDELSNFEHYHLGVFLPSNRTLDDIVKWFSDIDFVKSNSIQKIKSHTNTYLCYLQHKTKDAIAAGKSAPLDYACSDGLDFDTAIANYNEAISVDGIIENILSGSLRECDIYNSDDITDFIAKRKGAKSMIDNALKIYYNKKILKGVKDMNEGLSRKQAWIYGAPGSGKTILAEHMLLNNGYTTSDIYITASGKNPFDNYMGQRAIIIDDIDSDTMTAKTALKLMDMFTSSAIAARYSNKVIVADFIIVTSTISPIKWWNMNASSVDGDVGQLLRRLTLGCYYINGMKFEVQIYDGQGRAVNSTICPMPSDLMDKVNSKREDFALDFLKSTFHLPDGKDITISANNIKVDKDGGVSMKDIKIDDNLPGQLSIDDCDFELPFPIDKNDKQ